MPKLFPYQAVGARFLAEKGRALLADDMGLGKSAQAVVAANRLGAQTILVVCPASVVENWTREFVRFSTDSAATFAAMSYEKVQKAVLPATIDVLVLDEAHYLKTRTARRTGALFGPKCDGVGGLVERAGHVFLLTGTPTPNNPSELWPLLRAVLPDTIEKDGRPMSYWSFVNRYCRLRDTGFGIEIVGGKNLAELRGRIAPRVLRRKKSEVLADLPPIRFDYLYLDARVVITDPEVQAAEREIARVLDEEGIAGLRGLAPHVATLRRLTGLAKVQPAVDWIKDQLDGGLEKLVVFAHHREVIDALSDFVPSVRITGDTRDRQAVVDRFQADPTCRVLIGQIQAAGVGVTLTSASDVLFVESSWVPAENEQAAMRVHRIGQRNACLIRFATIAGSIDERIQRAVMRKTADIMKLFG